MVVLDTNIIIDHLRLANKQESALIKFVKKHPKETLTISVISVQELYEGKSTKNRQKEQALLAVISPLKILPYTYEIAKLAGKIARDLSEPIELALADAAIAATTIFNEGKLFTLNKKDFQKIPHLKFAV
jgi:predicted nucleic acid-binding protein